MDGSWSLNDLFGEHSSGSGCGDGCEIVRSDQGVPEKRSGDEKEERAIETLQCQYP